MKKIVLVSFLLNLSGIVYGQSLRWHLVRDQGITWQVKKGDTAHTDAIEMSGKKVSVILTYGTDRTQGLVLKKKIVFPMLRTIPNDTHGSLIRDFEKTELPAMLVNGKAFEELPAFFSFNGSVKITSAAVNEVSMQREIFPSADKAAVIENCIIYNRSSKPVRLVVPVYEKTDSTKQQLGVYGIYLLTTKIYGSGSIELLPGEKYTYSIVNSGRKITDQPYEFSSRHESMKRKDLISGLTSKLVLKTPDDTLNQMFSFAKIRAAESIYDTKNGLMHGPGGAKYYAAVWANDQAEYMNPFFPFLGDENGNESAINSFRLFAKYMNAAYKPIPSSIVAEGTDVWQGAGDRGDQAMIAYGASRFALAYGDTAQARKLWPLINWCLEYLRKQKSAQGVIYSDSDELEGRFPAGKINLSTNVLAYGALSSSSDLAAAMGNQTTAAVLLKEAKELRTNIEKYFGAKVQGFDTYQYYKGNTKLRSWIGLPLVMGIFERKDQTMKALFSDNLWTKDGMLSESGSKTFWDRSLLYAMRGLFNAGATDTTLKYLQYYSSRRLLGEHVPYAIEAWPEGDQRQLSAESGLYCRTITEGLFGLQPTGFNKFLLQPFLPAAWNEMSLNHIKAFNNDFDLLVTRQGKQLKIQVKQAGGKVQELLWDGQKPLEITL